MKKIQIKKVFNEVDTQNLKKAYHISKEIENFLSDEKISATINQGIISTKGWLTKSIRKPFCPLFWGMLNRLILHPVKTAYDKNSQSGVYYYFWRTTFYLTDVNFIVYTFLLAKHTSKIRHSLKSRPETLEPETQDLKLENLGPWDLETRDPGTEALAFGTWDLGHGILTPWSLEMGH